MYKIYLLIAVGLGVVVNTSAEGGNLTKIEQLILNKCKVNSHEASAYDTLQEHLSQFSEYLRLTFSHLPKDQRTFCDSERSQLKELMKVLAKDMKQCVSKDEKYLPSFLYQSFVEFLDFLCDHNGRNIANFFSSLGNECMQNLQQHQAGQEVGHCFKKIRAPLNEVVKKQDLCSDLTTTKKCFSAALDKHCPNFRSFDNLNSELFKALREPCNSAPGLGISSLVLLIAAFFTTKIMF